MKISASRQVSDWLQSLPPETKGRVRAALRRLADGKPVDVKALQGELDGFCRLSVGEWRIVYRIVDRESLVDIVAIRHRREAYR